MHLDASLAGRLSHLHLIQMIDSVEVHLVVVGLLVCVGERHHEEARSHHVDLFVDLHHCHRVPVVDRRRDEVDHWHLGFHLDSMARVMIYLLR